MKVLIVGAGIGGLALAAFLESSSIEYKIIEKASDWNHQGYALGMWNNGRHILTKLGLGDVFDKASIRTKNYHIYNNKGRLLREYSLSKFHSQYGTGLNLIGRKDLHDWLMTKINSSKLLMNLTIEGLVQDKEKVKVTFSNGQSEEYDVVVGADGIHSKVRDMAFAEHALKTSKFRIWYMWIDNKYKKEASVEEYIGNGDFVSFFDTGERTLAIVVAPHHNLIMDNPLDRIQRLQSYFKDQTSLVPGLFESLKSEDIVVSDLIQVKLRTWFSGRVVLMGDAAHGFGPWAGIGASMALEDGYVLAGELMKVSEGYSLEKALKNYEKRRKRRVERARTLTHKMKAWALIRSKLIRRCFNWFVPYFPQSYLVHDYHKLLDEEI